MQNKLSVFANEKKVVSNFDPFSKEVLFLYIYIYMYIYTRYQLDEKQPIGQRHVERSSSANSYRDISLLFPSALNGCACARTNREQASRAASRTRLTRARERTTTNALARSLARHRRTVRGRWRVTTTSQDVVTVGHQ